MVIEITSQIGNLLDRYYFLTSTQCGYYFNDHFCLAFKGILQCPVTDERPYLDTHKRVDSLIIHNLSIHVMDMVYSLLSTLLMCQVGTFKFHLICNRTGRRPTVRQVLCHQTFQILSSRSVETHGINISNFNSVLFISIRTVERMKLKLLKILEMINNSMSLKHLESLIFFLA